MSEEKSTKDIQIISETALMDIEEEKLPMILSERLALLEETNAAYSVAKEKEKQASDKVAKALTQADALVAKANGAGKHTADKHHFLGVEWTSKKEEISVLKSNLQEMIDCGIDSAAAQKELVEVQKALTESQTAILQVQEKQMAYQRQIADATKFLYGLSAYNMASSQSVLINLQAVLSGMSKEKLGEMAEQQLMLALDQIRNQESIIIRVKENRDLIESLDVDLAEQEKQVKANTSRNDELEKRIEALNKAEQELFSKGVERDRLLQAGIEHDKKQDEEIAAQAEKDAEHDRLLRAGAEHDKKQDAEIAAQAKKDEEHDKLLKAGAEHDEKQDAEIAAQAKKDEEHDKLLKASAEYDKKQDERIRLQELKNIEHDDILVDLKKQTVDSQKSIEENHQSILALEEKIQNIENEKSGKKSVLIAYVIATISLGISILHFFL